METRKRADAHELRQMQFLKNSCTYERRVAQGVIVTGRFEVRKIGGLQTQHMVDADGGDESRNAACRHECEYVGAYHLGAASIVSGNGEKDHWHDHLNGDRTVRSCQNGDEFRVTIGEIEKALEV